MPENRPSIVKRIAQALRRCRELLATPELLNNVEQQIKESLSRIEVMAHKLDALSSDLKGEVAAELSFTVLDYAKSITQLGDLVGELKTNFDLRMNSLETFQSEARNLVAELNTSLNSRMNSLETFQSETRNLASHLSTSLNSRMNSLETFQSETRNLLEHLGTSLGSRMNGLETIQSETKNLVNHVRTASEARFNSIDNQQYETKNVVDHINTSIHTRLDAFENQTLPSISDQIHEVIATQFELLNRTSSQRPRAADPAERYKPARNKQWKASLERTKREFPKIYPLWKIRLDAMLEAFRQTKAGNAAWEGDVYSRIFRSFVERYASGRVLDVGCGVFRRPYYLLSYPAKLVSGIDPLEPIETPDFEFARGITEYLAWPENAFSTVVSATSLDHCLSLDRSLAEIQRVLRPGGCFLLWIGSNPGAPKYEPDAPGFVPADKFHLFHFDVSWFEPMLLKSFTVIDRVELHKTGYSHVMYSLQLKAKDFRRSEP